MNAKYNITSMKKYYISEVKGRALALKLLPQDILDLEAQSVLFCVLTPTDYYLSLSPKGEDDATRHQWEGQTIKLLESCGCIFPEKPTPSKTSVTWKGKLKINDTVNMEIEIFNCPIPLGCIIKKTSRVIPEQLIPEHIEEVNEVVCLEDERNALNTLVEA